MKRFFMISLAGLFALAFTANAQVDKGTYYKALSSGQE